MTQRIIFYLAISLMSIGSVAFAVDAMVVTDEERILTFIETVTGEVRADRIDAALHYVDPVRQPVEITIGEQRDTYSAAQSLNLTTRTREALEPMLGKQIRLIQHHLQIDNDRVHVTLRAATPSGAFNVFFTLARHGDGWLIQRMRLS